MKISENIIKEADSNSKIEKGSLSAPEHEIIKKALNSEGSFLKSLYDLITKEEVKNGKSRIKAK